MCLVLLEAQWRQPGVELRRLRNARGLVSAWGGRAGPGGRAGRGWACTPHAPTCSSWQLCSQLLLTALKQSPGTRRGSTG